MSAWVRVPVVRGVWVPEVSVGRVWVPLVADDTLGALEENVLRNFAILLYWVVVAAVSCPRKTFLLVVAKARD